MRYLEYSDSERQKVDWQLPGARGKGWKLFNGNIVSVLHKEEKFWRLRHNVNGTNTLAHKNS